MKAAMAGACLALLVQGSPAIAQDGGRDAAAAAELFQQGRRALQDHQYPEACARFAESQRLDPKVGTLINLAMCEQGSGHLARAARRWDEALELARSTSDPRQGYVTEQRDALAPSVPWCILQPAPSSPPGTVVRLDDETTSLPLDSSPTIAVDPGAHVARVSAPGRAERPFPFSAAEGGRVTVVVEPGDAIVVPSIEPSGRGNVPRILAYVAGGLGVVGVGVGAVFAAQAISARNDPRCSQGVCADPADAQTQRDGAAAGDRANIAFAVGGAMIAGGVVLWLTAPRGPQGSRSNVAWLSATPTAGGTAVTAGTTW
jgi:hypothetical protein